MCVVYVIIDVYRSLTIVAIETRPDELVVVCDLVHNSTKTADTVLYDLRNKHNKWNQNKISALRAVSHLNLLCFPGIYL